MEIEFVALGFPFNGREILKLHLAYLVWLCASGEEEGLARPY
jgi:hypothetical protein